MSARRVLPFAPLLLIPLLTTSLSTSAPRAGDPDVPTYDELAYELELLTEEIESYELGDLKAAVGAWTVAIEESTDEDALDEDGDFLEVDERPAVQEALTAAGLLLDEKGEGIDEFDERLSQLEDDFQLLADAMIEPSREPDEDVDSDDLDPGGLQHLDALFTGAGDALGALDDILDGWDTTVSDPPVPVNKFDPTPFLYDPVAMACGRPVTDYNQLRGVIGAIVRDDNIPINGGVLEGYSTGVVGGPGDDFIIGTSADDLIYGNGGNDCIRSLEGDDEIYGDRGSHWPSTSTGLGVYVGMDEVDVAWLGNNGDDVVFAGTGNDEIDGDGGADWLWGEDGNDVIEGAGGGDLLRGGDGNDDMDGGTGDDRVQGDDGNDELHGNSGEDDIFGGPGDDWIRGDSGGDFILGDAGADDIRGELGDDEIFGGPGDDDLRGGSGKDTMYGDADNDTMRGDGGQDRMWGMSGNDSMWGESGADAVLGDSGSDQVRGGSGDDGLSGGTDNDQLWGGSGRDNMNAGSGNDYAEGEGGRDTIRGGDGDDTIFGNSSRDYLYGGSVTNAGPSSTTADGFDFTDGGSSGLDTCHAESENRCERN